MCESPPADHARENCIRCNELEAEVAQLRQDRDEMVGKLRAWAEAEDKIIEALGPRDRDILQRIQQLVAGEAARDHLRARLRELAQEMSTCVAGFREANGTWKPLADPALAYDVKRWADLLAVLTEPLQEEKEHNDNDLARVGTMGEGLDSRTASEASAGSVGPITPAVINGVDSPTERCGCNKAWWCAKHRPRIFGERQ